MTKEIAQAFGVESQEFEKTPRITTPVPSSVDEFTHQLVENKKIDYTKARDNILNLLQDMEQVVGDAVEAVRSSPSARMIEAFSNLVKTYSEVNKDLISLSDSAPSSKPSFSSNDNQPVSNVIFVGTSDSLIDQIKAHSR